MKLEEEKEGKYPYNLDGDIVFHNVSICVSNKEILSNLNFAIKKGEKVAILGENGSGKSILAKAILGFYEKEGNIYLNYHNSKELDASNIRKYIDYISGEFDLFSGTLLENIELGEHKTQEELTKVVKEAEMEQDIKRLENGYQTIVGEKGVKLSGGQKQRILLARALLRNKPIMIFDNAFSKLDDKTSDKILQSLVRKHPEKTILFISHKEKIENYVEKIIRLEEGTSERI